MHIHDVPYVGTTGPLSLLCHILLPTLSYRVYIEGLPECPQFAFFFFFSIPFMSALGYRTLCSTTTVRLIPLKASNSMPTVRSIPLYLPCLIYANNPCQVCDIFSRPVSLLHSELTSGVMIDRRRTCSSPQFTINTTLSFDRPNFSA